MTRFQNLPPQENRDSKSSPTSASNCAGSKDMIELAISGITGLAVGAGLMYIFDPEAGSQRRERIGDAAHSAFDATTGSISGVAGGVGEYVSDLTSRMGGGHHTWSDVADDYRGRIGSTLESAKSVIAPYIGAKARRGYMSSVRDHASSGYRGASKSASRYVPRVHFGDQDHGFSKTTAGIGAVGALALGCAAMYFLDARNGAARRSFVLDKAVRLFKDTGDLARATGRHIANRSRGMAHSARSKMTTEQVDDQTLEQRIRSQLGHFGNVRQLDVTVMNGVAIIRGHCSQPDIQNMVAAAGAVRGVQRVQCELQATGSTIAPQPTQPNTTAI